MMTYTADQIEVRYRQRLDELLPGVDRGYLDREQAERSARWWAEGEPAYDGPKRTNGATGGAQRVNGSAHHPPESEAPEPGNGVTIGGALTLALRMPDVEYVLLPILTKGQLGTLTGHPGSCKTTLFVGIAAALALDRPFGPLSPEADGLVYIVSAEDFQGTRNRIFAEAVRLQLDGDERIRLDDRMRWVHVESNVGAATIRAEIERDAAGRDVALIFVDTGPALFCGDDENDNVALRNFVEGFRQMAELPGSPVTVLAWHPNKGATADRLEPRGASAIKGTVDFCLTAWRDDDRVTLGYTKVRAQHFDPIEGRLSAIDLVAGSGAQFSAPVVTLDIDERAERSDATEAREAILRALYGTHAPPTVRDLAAAASLSKSAIGRHLQHLSSVKPAMVTKDAITDRYSLTNAGRDRARDIQQQTAKAYANGKDPG